jgi:hypothetical protein
VNGSEKKGASSPIATAFRLIWSIYAAVGFGVGEEAYLRTMIETRMQQKEKMREAVNKC